MHTSLQKEGNLPSRTNPMVGVHVGLVVVVNKGLKGCGVVGRNHFNAGYCEKHVSKDIMRAFGIGVQLVLMSEMTSEMP